MELISADEIHEQNMRDAAYRGEHWRTWLSSHISLLWLRLRVAISRVRG